MPNNSLRRLGLYSTLGYIFFSVVPFAAAGKNICIVFMLFAFIALLMRKQIRNIPLGWLPLSLYLVLGLAFFSAILSPYAADSLNQLRKDGLPFLLGFLLLTASSPSDPNKTVVYTMLSLIYGYAVKEILALWSGSANGFQFSIYELQDKTLPKYMDFFSADTPYYLPFLLGPLLFWSMKYWQRVVLSVLVFLAILVVVVSGVRTALIFVVTSVLLILVYRLWNTKKRLFVVLAVLCLSGYLLKGHVIGSTSIARYSSIVSTQTYQLGKDGSVSERYAIIKGVWEICQDRLLLGYGLGWKKLPKVAEANGHMDRWRNSSGELDKVALRYFTFGEGRVNPHNFYMSLLFENGLIGLSAYVSFLLASIVIVFKLLFKKPLPFEKGIASACMLYMIVYLGGSVLGGSWLPVTMLVTVSCLTILQHKSEVTG